jgi:predicted ribosome quality control (RQC) complex YloA/Tae2 family protein
MSFDGIVVHALVHELKNRLIGGRITKIHQPYPADLLFQIRAGSTNYKLLISANLSFPRIYLTDETYTNPQEPPMFTMLLRKYIEGGIIQKIEQVALERIIHIDLQARDELGDLKTLRLVVEIMGRHSNIILMDAERNMILDGIHHVTPSISTYRQVLPGRPYVAPPAQEKLNPLETDRNTFYAALSFNEGKLAKQLVDRFQGISPLVAEEILYRAGLPTRENLWHAFHQLFQEIKDHQYAPNIVTGKKSYFSVIELTHIEGQKERFASVSECLQQYFQTKAADDLHRQTVQDLLRMLTTERNKNIKKLEKLKATIADAAKAEQFKVWGELITAYQFMIKQGDQVALLPNYYEENEPLLEIPLDPLLTPNENAQTYFKKYNKAKNSIKAVDEQMERTTAEIAYLDEIITQIELADPKSLEEIREELVEQGYLRDRKRARSEKKKKAATPQIERFISSEGYTIYVGKNHTQNDYLTKRLAKNSDTWLHTKDIPGSHVVIAGEGFGEQTLKEAAMLAAYYSKGRYSSSVPVDYTLIRHVHKPSGSKPGFVIYDNQKTLYVTPDEEIIKGLKN